MTKTIDYDVWKEPVEGLTEVDDTEYAEIPLDVIDEELVVTPLPIQRDEFRCRSCFLIRHVSQLVSKEICLDCA